jgi:hypothetical protein
METGNTTTPKQRGTMDQQPIFCNTKFPEPGICRTNRQQQLQNVRICSRSKYSEKAVGQNQVE